MLSELKTDLDTPRRRHANGDVRLNPLPPQNTLLTVLFFSAVVLAIGYWIFFPPVAPPAPETAAAPQTVQSSPDNPSKSRDPIRSD